jgi:hypothetical protein
MLRHRFRQKIGMTTESPLENFIDEILGEGGYTSVATGTVEDTSEEAAQS